MARKPKGFICTVNGCERGAVLKEWCNRHYQSWYHYGDPEAAKPKSDPKEGPCEIEGCERPRRSLSSKYCETHYYRKRRTGTTDDPLYKGWSYDVQGYVIQRVSLDHPLCTSQRRPWVRQNRVVFSEEYGAKAHDCHWCGESVPWEKLHIDHINDIKDDNRLSNLVASCATCNKARGHFKMVNLNREHLGTFIECDGRRQTVSEWAREVGISDAALVWRIDQGWPIAKALSEPRGVTGPRPDRRKKFSKYIRQAICARQDWQCACGCGGDLKKVVVHIDHIKPLWAGGTNNSDNLQALLPEHHVEKTRSETTQRAKADRVGRKHRGEWRGPKKPMQSRGFSKTYRKKMNGEVVKNE